MSNSSRWSRSDPAGRCHLLGFFFPDAAVGVKFRGESSNMRPRPLVLRKERTGVREKGWALGPGLRRRRAEVCILASDGRGLGPQGL